MAQPANLPMPLIDFSGNTGGTVVIRLEPETINGLMVNRVKVISPADMMGVMKFVPVAPSTTSINMTSIGSGIYGNRIRTAGCTWDPFTNSVMANNEISLCEREAQYQLCSDEFKEGYRVLLDNDGRGFTKTAEGVAFVNELLGTYSDNTLTSLLLTAKLGGFYTEAEMEAWVLANDDKRATMIATLTGCDGWLKQICDLAAGDETNYGYLNRTDLITTSTDFTNGGKVLKSDVAVDALNALYNDAPATLANMLDGTYVQGDKQIAPVYLINSALRVALENWASQNEGTTNDYGMNVRMVPTVIEGRTIMVPYFRNIPCLVDKSFDIVNIDNLSTRLFLCYLTVMENIQVAAGFDIMAGGSAMTATVYGSDQQRFYGNIDMAGYYRFGAAVANPDAITGFAHVEPLT